MTTVIDQQAAARAIARVSEMPHHAFDAKTFAHMLRVEPAALIDPFLGIDAFNMPECFFLPHPHGGMSAITLLFSDSPGGVRNRDSMGDDSIIEAGDLHWTQAGKGIIHEETPSVIGQPAVGLQIFVNMAKQKKYMDAAVFKVKRDAMPAGRVDDATVVAVAGSLPGSTAHSPIDDDPRWATHVGILDVTVDANGQVRLPVPVDHNVFFIWHAGDLVVGDQTVSQPVCVLWAGANQSEVPFVQLNAGAAGLRGVLFHGKPLNEPVFPHGPFTGNTKQDIVNYIEAYQDGAMGELNASFSRG
jgi:redox-sensitive bicupin YhaK (pirin superfamily)